MYVGIANTQQSKKSRAEEQREIQQHRARHLALNENSSR